MGQEIDKFIDTQVNLINKGFELLQIRKDCWRFCLSKFANSLVLEAIIDNSMQLYASIVLRIEQQRQKEQKIFEMKDLSNWLNTNQKP